MTTKKNIGLWLDHSTATFISENPEVQQVTITLDFDAIQKEEVLKRSEKILHNKEQQKQAIFYKKIAEGLAAYDNILLFGPSDAKLELTNFLKKNDHFNNKKIEIKSSDEQTENQKIAIVKDYFAEKVDRNF